jgi:hypothetical protein
MNKVTRLGLAAALSLAVIGGPTAASANDRDVIRRGGCSGRADWKLKLSPEDGRIEVEFEVDQNVNGRPWRVTLKRDGNQFFQGVRTTGGRSGSFELRRVTSNGRGPDRFVAFARALDGGQTCRGAATV